LGKGRVEWRERESSGLGPPPTASPTLGPGEDGASTSQQLLQSTAVEGARATAQPPVPPDGFQILHPGLHGDALPAGQDHLRVLDVVNIGDNLNVAAAQKQILHQQPSTSTPATTASTTGSAQSQQPTGPAPSSAQTEQPTTTTHGGSGPTARSNSRPTAQPTAQGSMREPEDQHLSIANNGGRRIAQGVVDPHRLAQQSGDTDVHWLQAQGNQGSTSSSLVLAAARTALQGLRVTVGLVVLGKVHPGLPTSTARIGLATRRRHASLTGALLLLLDRVLGNDCHAAPWMHLHPDLATPTASIVGLLR
jgi:hypothetical protein